MHSEPQKITIYGIEECEYAVHYWNCGKNNANLPFTILRPQKSRGGNNAEHNRTNNIN